jgi:ElaB/YqjD/DUF883 family membrane-anchored ribosome-binding protein
MARTDAFDNEFDKFQNMFDAQIIEEGKVWDKVKRGAKTAAVVGGVGLGLAGAAKVNKFVNDNEKAAQEEAVAREPAPDDGSRKLTKKELAELKKESVIIKEGMDDVGTIDANEHDIEYLPAEIDELDQEVENIDTSNGTGSIEALAEVIDKNVAILSSLADDLIGVVERAKISEKRAEDLSNLVTNLRQRVDSIQKQSSSTANDTMVALTQKIAQLESKIGKPQAATPQISPEKKKNFLSNFF